MPTPPENRRSIFIFAAIWVLFLLTRIIGGGLFENNWTMAGWDYLPVWLIGLVVLIPVTAWLLLLQADRASWSRRSIHISVGILAGLTFALGMDSFVFSGGNLRIAQLAQVPTVIWRSYEWGTMAIADGLYRLWTVADLPANQAGMYSWRTLAWINTALSFLGTWLICCRLTAFMARRLALLVLIWFGPQLLVLTGYIGVEGTVAVTTIWFALLLVKLNHKFTYGRLVGLWLVLFLGCMLYAGNLYLLPAAVFAAVGGKAASLKRLRLAAAAGILVTALMVAGLYLASARWFGLSRYLLFLDGKPPFGDYGLFSARHLGDMAQLLWILIPGSLAVKLATLGHWRRLAKDRTLLGLALMCLSGGVVVFLSDPFHSVVLDLPRLAVFLTPLAITAAVVLARVDWGPATARLLLPTAAALAVAAMVSILPTYLRLANVDPAASAYFDRHDWYYRDGSLAFRDAYFYRGQMDPANAWEQGRMSNSPDYLDMVGINDLVHSDRAPEAITRLYAIKTRNRYWIEARSILAGLQMQAGRFEAAKPEIDTMMMIDPWRRESLMNLYIYHRETGAYAPAMSTIDRALRIFPNDGEILTDKMLLYHRLGDYAAADSMATALISVDQAMPYPYFIRGIYEDSRGNVSGATGNYEQFLRLAPGAPEESRVRDRLAQLKSGDGS
ncbi:MAG: hypothetical protein ABIE70_02680 [bacterium]